MKHTFSLSVLLFAICFTAMAQEETPEATHEHHAAFHPYQELMLGHGVMPSGPSGLREDRFYGTSLNTTTGAISGTYRLHFSRLLSLGITGVYNNSNYKRNDKIVTSYQYGTFNTHYTYPELSNIQRTTFTVASELTFTYLRSHNDLVKLYSSIGLGYSIANEKDTYGGIQSKISTPATLSTHYASNICLFGIRAGRALGGYAELGRGYKGSLCYGMYYSF